MDWDGSELNLRAKTGFGLPGEPPAEGLAPDPLWADLLCLACAWGNEEMARQLLAAGVSPDGPGARGLSPLMSLLDVPGVLPDLNPCLDLLLSAGAQADLEGAGGRTALHAACEGGFLGAARKLLDAGADPRKKDASGRGPVLRAALRRSFGLCMLLAERGGDPDETMGGASALSEAADAGDEEAVAGLLALKANPGAVYSAAGFSMEAVSFTPLMRAACRSRRLCELMLEAGADPGARAAGPGGIMLDAAGWALQAGKPEIAQWLNGLAAARAESAQIGAAALPGKAGRGAQGF